MRHTATDPGLYCRDTGPTLQECEARELERVLNACSLAACLATQHQTVELDTSPKFDGDGYSFDLKFWSIDAAGFKQQLRAMLAQIERE